MIIFPAVDIKDGKAVRLRRGRKDDCTVFADNPAAAARHWQEKGAQWLHVVDLDGAFDGHCANAELIGAITRETSLPVQAGGGIRTLDAARAYLDAGVTRLIIGTVALEDPDLFATLCQTFPGRIGVSLDAENGILKTRGWASDTGASVEDVLPRLKDSGSAFIIYTDIARDGMHTGVNLAALKALLHMTQIPVIIAGGVSTLADIKAIKSLEHPGNLEGIITGRAIYDGTLKLEEALALAAESF